MKSIIAILALVAAVSARPQTYSIYGQASPTFYSGGGGSVYPSLYSGLTTGLFGAYPSQITPYTGLTTGLVGAYPSPVSAVQYGAPVAVQYSAPVQTVASLQPGYYARNPGAVHVAPLPAGLGYASHHINDASAP